MIDPEGILSTYWGYGSFRPMQKEIITSALSGEDVLALMPTGGGKSICFQVPALARDGIAIVVTPLIALMKDQVANLRSRGIKALAVHSGMTSSEIDVTLDNAVYGDYKFLYVSPERLKTRIFIERASRMNVSFLVVDEAHCISQWGYDFRPDYLDIVKVKEFTGSPAVIAVTATATEKVASDIMDKLGFRKPNMFVSGFGRPNLSYVVRNMEDKTGQLLRILKSTGGSAIVYVRQRKRAEEVAALLRSKGISADFYHAGMPSELRSCKQNAWLTGKVRTMVSTNAFGMGIDKPDVRVVVHYDTPESVEAYFQEAGRAGRDGRRSYAVLLSSPSDLANLKKFVPVAFPDFDFIADVYQKVFIYLQIPYESGAGEMYRFDIGDFCSRYRLPASKAHYALKIIEREGYWTIAEDVENPSRLMFIVNRDELYRVQLKSGRLDSFIKTVMRLYPGLFSESVRISEEYIARMHKCSVESVKSMLMELSRGRIVKYVPAFRSTMVIFNNERLVPSNFCIDRQRCMMLKDSYVARLDAIADYVTDSSQCRAVKLSAYFSQKVEPCGCCDVCIASRTPDSAAESAVLSALGDGSESVPISELRLELEGRYPDILEHVRNLVASGRIVLENNEEYVRLSNGG